MDEQILQKAQEAIDAKIFPGGVIGYVKTNGERNILPFGNFTYDAGAQEVKSDSIFDVASLTKSLATGCLALKLIDEGKLSVEDKLVDYIPEFSNSDKDTVLIRHLLTYTIDGYGLASLGDIPPEELHAYIMKHDFNSPPGKVFKYTNIPAYLLGLVVEKIYGSTLDVLAQEYFYKPLGMTRTTFHPELLSKEEIVPTEIDNRGIVQGVVHDESAYIFKTKGNKVVGHAGLFSTAGDTLTFLEMLLHKGTFKGTTYFSEKMIGEMGTNQIETLGDSTGLGWELNQPRFMGKNCGPHTFGKTGFTGTLCVCDVEKGIAYVVLTNRIYPTRPKDASVINAFRAAIGEIIISK
ncbi:MAG: serine hydrolase domain-containing protein [Patescibacteria group bacterium]